MSNVPREATSTTVAGLVRDLLSKRAEVREAYVNYFATGKPAEVRIELANGQRFYLSVVDDSDYD
jgi:hypothetical protein